MPTFRPCQAGRKPVAKALLGGLSKTLLDAAGLLSPKGLSENAPVAQLDRAPDYESGGQEFESLRARHHLPKNTSFYKMLRIYRCI